MVQMTGQRASVLEDFQEALLREAPNVAMRPDLLWQQVFNRLQWAAAPTLSRLGDELETRSAVGATPWLRTKSPYRESTALVRTLVGHADTVAACEVSPNGTFIVSASHDGTLRVWDFDTGRERVTLRGHDGPVNDCAISPDSRLVASAGADGTVRVWEVASGAEHRSFPGHVQVELAEARALWGSDPRDGPVDPSKVSASSAASRSEERLEAYEERLEERSGTGALACVFSVGGSSVISAGDDGTLRIWDLATGQLSQTYEPDPFTTTWTNCAQAPNGVLIAAGGVDGSVHIWDMATGRERTIPAPSRWSEKVNGCAFSPDGMSLISASQDGALRVWDVESGEEEATLVEESRVHTRRPSQAAKDEFHEMSGKAPRQAFIKLMGRMGHLWKRLASRLRGCAYSPDGTLVVVGGGDFTLKVFDPATGELRARLVGHAEVVCDCAVSPDGGFVVSAGGDNQLKVWDLSRAQDAGDVVGHTLPVFGVAFSPDGSLLASASGDETLKLFDTEMGLERRTLVGHTDPVQTCAFSGDGSLLISGAADDTLKVWDLASGRERATLIGHTDEVEACAVSRDSSFVVSGGGGRLKVWDLASGRERMTLTGHSIFDCALTPEEKEVVSAGGHGLTVWDLATGRERATIGGHSGGVDMCVAVSPDGTLVAAGDREGTARVWDLATGAERHLIGRFPGSVDGCAFSPDGALVAVASANVVAIWDVHRQAVAASTFLPAVLSCLTWHPLRPLIACGDLSGAVHMLEVIGLPRDAQPPQTKEVSRGRLRRLFGRRDHPRTEV